MHTGEWLTRGTVWLALAIYVASEIMKVTRRSHDWGAWARWLNSFGCAAFLAHVACAFHFYHAWSHPVAYADTARQTAELFGWNWGGGLYVNYLFALVWVGEVVWSWTDPNHYIQRPKWILWTVRGFFLFMMFNGAVVFARGDIRWFGWLLCLTLAGCWLRGRRPISGPPDHSASA